MTMRPEDRGPGVYHDVVLDDRVAVDPLDRGPVLVEREALRAERHALIDADTIADARRLADDDAGAVIDEEPLADRRAGVDVDAGEGVGVLRDDARDERDAEHVQLVGDALVRDREHAGVREDRLVAGLQRGVALVGRLDVGGDEPPDLRDPPEERARHSARGVGAVVAGLDVVPVVERDAAPDLILERAQGARERRADEVVQALVVEVARPEVAGEEHRADILDELDHRLARRERHLAAGRERRPQRRVAAEPIDHRGERHGVHRRDPRLLRFAHFASSNSHVER